ncbi:MAG: FAD-dependent monooxygenase [Candidatus ainarchaeum sp.]|nr:FAD-dependent monooxygenase [Candidatus ainarchaeum sp.]
MERFDALVIGAGAAGAVAALKLSREGCRTLLIDKAARVGGHSAGKVDITQDAGIRGIILELGIPRKPFVSHSNKSEWNSRNSSFFLESSVTDLFVARGRREDSFEALVSGKAEDAGCELRLSTQVKILELGEGGFSALELASNGSRAMVKADCIIAADGTRSGFAKSCFPSLAKEREVVISGHGMLAKGLCLDGCPTRIYFDSELLPGGYFYMGACGREGEGVAAAVVDSALASGRGAKWFFDRFAGKNKAVRTAVSRAKVRGTFSGSCSAGRMPSRHHRNALFAGDAARLLDPLLGYGLNHAIFSGYHAARAWVEKRWEGSEAVAREYEAALAEKVLPELNDGERAKRVFNRLSNQDLDMLVGFLDQVSEKVKLDEFFDSPSRYPAELLGTLASRPKYALLLRHLHHLL